MRAHTIEKLTLSEAAAAERLELPLAPGLNVLIGGCGSYKTALLHAMRFALGAPPPVDPVQRADYDARVRAALGAGGVATAHVETAQGVRYTSERTLEEGPRVRDADGKVLEKLTLTGDLFRCHFFGPHEIEGIAMSPDAQLALIDRFDEVEIRRVSAEIDQVRRRWREALRELRAVRTDLAEDEERLAELPQVEEALKGMQRSEGAADALAVARAHEEKTRRGKERLALGTLAADVAHVKGALAELAKAAALRVGRAADASLEAGPHAETFRRAHAAAQRAGAAIEDLARHADDALAAAARDVDDLVRSLAGAHATEDEAYAALLARQHEDGEQAAARERVQRRYDELLLLQKHADARRREHDAKQEATDRVHAELREKIERLHAVRLASIAKIKARHGGDTIGIELKEAADRRAYGALLKDDILKGLHLDGDVIDAIANRIAPADLVDAVRRDDVEPIMAVDPLPTKKAARARRILDRLRDSGRLEEIETVPLGDVPLLTLKVGNDQRPSTQLSHGQRCICVLGVVLLLAEGPIVIDQPEDSIDGRYIKSVLVPALRALKKDVQIVFASHQPNILVLAEADRVILTSGERGHAEIVKHGTSPEMRGEVEDLLECGPDAFRTRGKLYGHVP